MSKLPWMKFFPKDWLADERARLCSVAARGLWMDLLCLMHSSPRRGYLQTATGLPLPLEQIARLTGCSTDEATRLSQELLAAGVYDCTEHGVMYSRRMVREAEISLVRSEVGRKGGNPRLVKQNATKRPSKPQPNVNPSEVQRLREEEGGIIPPDPPTPRPPPNAVAVAGPPAIPAGLDTPEFRAAWADWLADRKARRRPVTDRAAKGQLEALAGLAPAAAAACVRDSINNGWTGLFPDKYRGGRSLIPPRFQTKGERETAHKLDVLFNAMGGANGGNDAGVF